MRRKMDRPVLGAFKLRIDQRSAEGASDLRIDQRSAENMRERLEQEV
jgi:hypothetical protein